MRILVTGGSGFAGQYLLDYLQQVEPEAKLIATTIDVAPTNPQLATVDWVVVNLLDTQAVFDLLKNHQPDIIYHLAALSAPSKALTAAWQTLENNVKMQFNLIHACIELNISPQILLITSGDIYDTRSNTGDPIAEETPLCANNPYALSKITQDMMGLQYYLSHQLPIIRIRPFNHTGAGQALGFVAPDFAMQIARIEAGLQEPIIRVGNLEAYRDFSDVRDVVKAYYFISKYGEAGEAYNVASGKATSIAMLLQQLIDATDIDIDVQVDTAKLRPVDTPIIVGSAQKLTTLTGWQPTIDIQTTLHDLLHDCRERVLAKST